jgi:outer membrane immunogenic protein
MNKLILGTAALSAVGLVSVASAADLPVKAPPIVPVVYNWTGCYIGANGGWKWARFNESVDTAESFINIPGRGVVPLAPGHVDLDHATTSSGAAGGQIGCRWENAEHWVIGAEGDFDWTNLHATAVDAAPPAFGLFQGDSFGNHVRWESSARFILGRSYGQWLFYGTGGVAFSRVEMDANFIPVLANGIFPFPGSVGSDSNILIGGTVGLGTVYMINRNWEIGGEYRYTFYGQRDFGLGTGTPFCTRPLSTLAPAAPVCVSPGVTGHKGLETQEVLFKVNYRFDWGPVVAKF